MTTTSPKTAVLVLSDPAVGGDEPLGRVFNALAAAYDLDQAGHTPFGFGFRMWERVGHNC
jgi:hypothetical protein